uniref:Uncharacterized protein n=1 Tax=Panagrolaimus sp. ES5 TaxID=591445 RepID=A0AC34FRP9_9BILA
MPLQYSLTARVKIIIQKKSIVALQVGQRKRFKKLDEKVVKPAKNNLDLRDILIWDEKVEWHDLEKMVMMVAAAAAIHPPRKMPRNKLSLADILSFPPPVLCFFPRRLLILFYYVSMKLNFIIIINNMFHIKFISLSLFLFVVDVFLLP